MKMLTRLVGLLALLLLTSAAKCAFLPSALPPLEGHDSAAHGIDALGRVVGRSAGTAVLWDRDGEATALPPSRATWAARQ